MHAMEGPTERANDRWTDIALLLMRLALGWVFIYHGAGKLFGYADQGGLSGTSDYFAYLHIQPSGLWAMLAGGLEFFGGLGMVVGFLVRVAGALLFVEMTLAYFIANFTCCMLPSPHSKAGDGAQINVALGVLALAVALMGAGWYSLDRLLGTDRLLIRRAARRTQTDVSG
jgi:putative oxidoreductase